MATTLDEFQELIRQHEAILVYYSTPGCNVCKTLQPKVRAMLKERFPRIAYLYVDSEESKEVAAQNSIFAVPTIVVYFDGREAIRKSRFVGVSELASEIERLYDLIFAS